LAWISNGELVAVNVAERTGGRPRWRIRRSDLEDFLHRRQNVAPPTRSRRTHSSDYTAKYY
jgi:hypothetical protein